MDPWVFNKKELRFIAKLMTNKLHSLPDNSELTVMDLFSQALQSEWVEGKTHEGYNISGYKVTDIKLDDGTFLHDHIKWDFKNGVWEANFKQAFTLNHIFSRMIRKKGYIEDLAIRGGRRMGYPHLIPSIYRKKEKLISSFVNVEEKVIDNGNHQKYFIREYIETKHNHHRYRNNEISCYDTIKPLQLWRIPKGCKTSVIDVVDDYIYFTVLKGKCHIESEYWQYERVEKKKPSWQNYKGKIELKIYLSHRASFNRKEKYLDAPQKAWFQITNEGKSDLLLFVVDTSRFKYIDYNG